MPETLPAASTAAVPRLYVVLHVRPEKTKFVDVDVADPDAIAEQLVPGHADVVGRAVHDSVTDVWPMLVGARFVGDVGGCVSAPPEFTALAMSAWIAVTASGTL